MTTAYQVGQVDDRIWAMFCGQADLAPEQLVSTACVLAQLIPSLTLLYDVTALLCNDARVT